MEKAETNNLYENEDVLAWRHTLNSYNKVLKLKAEKASGKAKKDRDLIALDNWYQNDLPKNMKSREKTYINLEELCRLMTWKLTRGKFRPKLSDLVKANDEPTVKETSRKAFECLPDVSSAIRELSKLKAVGPATASAILSAGAPDLVPFMADEAMMGIPSLGEINYKLPFYMLFVEKITKVLEKLKEKDSKGEWTAHKIELALWTEVMAKKLNVNLSEELHTDCHENGRQNSKRKATDNVEALKKKAKKM